MIEYKACYNNKNPFALHNNLLSKELKIEKDKYTDQKIIEFAIQDNKEDHNLRNHKLTKIIKKQNGFNLVIYKKYV